MAGYRGGWERKKKEERRDRFKAAGKVWGSQGHGKLSMPWGSVSSMCVRAIAYARWTQHDFWGKLARGNARRQMGSGVWCVERRRRVVEKGGSRGTRGASGQEVGDFVYKMGCNAGV